MDQVWHFAANYPVWFTIGILVVVIFMKLTAVFIVGDPASAVRNSARDAAMMADHLRQQQSREF